MPGKIDPKQKALMLVEVLMDMPMDTDLTYAHGELLRQLTLTIKDIDDIPPGTGGFVACANCKCDNVPIPNKQRRGRCPECGRLNKVTISLVDESETDDASE